MTTCDDIRIVYPPNRPMDRYIGPSQKPVLYEKLLFIEANQDGNILLGSSNINSTYWEGTLFCYENIADAKENKYCAYYIASSPIVAAKFLHNCGFSTTPFLVIAENSQNIRVCIKECETAEKCSDEKVLTCVEDYEHIDGNIESVAIWDHTNAFVTSEATTVSLYDVNDTSIQQLNTYSDYHTAIINDVDVKQDDRNQFATVSQDRYAYTWDSRLEKPCNTLYSNEFAALTTVSWNAARAEMIAVGSEAGDVYLLDTRNPGTFLSVTADCLDGAAVQRIKWENNNADAADGSKRLAVCGASSRVRVLSLTADGTNLEGTYSNTDHADLARDVAWFHGEMYTCGFDGKVRVHAV